MDKKVKMTDMFKGYFNYSKEEYKNIWNDSIIVVDTNILLNFYRYSEDTRNKLFKILEKLKPRLWIPYQVGKEFFNNKNKVMVNSYNEYNALISMLKKRIQEAKDEINKRKNNQLKCKNDINDILNTSMNQIEKLLEEEKTDKKPKFEENNVETEILSLFNDSIGEKIVGDEYNEMKEEGLRRFKESIPPGFKDNNKEENGDYYIFYSIKKKAKELKKNVIFITDDVKEDWFNNINGEKHGGRCELLNEFYKDTGKLLLIYTSDGFAEAYNKNIDKDFADENTINELKSIRSIRTNEDYFDVNLFDKDFLKKLSYYRRNIDNFTIRKELLTDLKFIIKTMNISNYEKERLLHELMIMSYSNNNSNKDELLKIIDKINSYCDVNYNIYIMNDEINNLFCKKYYNCFISLKKAMGKSVKLRNYNLLMENINEHLEYLSHFQSKESCALCDELEELASLILEDIRENNFTNENKIIKQLSLIIENNKVLVKESWD